MDHTYLRVDPGERLPKKQTPKTKRKRESSTPTGRTPVQISKRTSLCDVSS